MTDRPIILAPPMVRAVLDGKKTQERRFITRQPRAHPKLHKPETGKPYWRICDSDRNKDRVAVPFAVGDRLWVKEAWARLDDCKHDDPGPNALIENGFFRADHPEGLPNDIDRWRSSIFMPRRASRITLIVTNVRVQRLQDISRDDAIAEGIQRVGGNALRWENWSGPEGKNGLSPEAAFALLWDFKTPGQRYSWAQNPYVIAITFLAHRRNIDQMETRHASSVDR